MKPGEHAGLSVARFLRPEEQVVPFRSRPELDELLGWCTSGAHVGIRLVTGYGGAGKTRLALRLGEKLKAKKWQQLWVKRGSEREAVADVHEMRQPCVLMVDYAETRGGLAGLLDDVAADEAGPDLRVVLMARSAGEWWQQLLANAEEVTAALLEASEVVTLGPLRATGGPQEIFDDAVAAFAKKVGIDRPDARVALSDPDPVVLVVHAAALLAVADCAAGVRPRHQTASGSEVLEALLRHEARYWARTAASRGLDLDLSVLRLAVAAGCLIGAESETAAVALLACIPDLELAERRGRVARWLHDLYPAAYEDEEQRHEWLGPLRPDRLAEQLVTRELARRPDLIPLLFTGLSATRAVRALTVLARAANNLDRAVDLIRRALTADLDHLAIPALEVAGGTNALVGDLLGQAMDTQPVSPETLRWVAAAIQGESFALAAPAAVAFKLLAEGSADDSERAWRLTSLSSRLGDLGRREEALAAIEEAVSIYRQLAEAHPHPFLPNLATSLNNQSNCLADLGRQDEALAAIEEAINIRRQIRSANRGIVFEDHFYLAGALSNQSLHLSDLGRREEALAAIEEAVSIYRQVVEARPGAWQYTSFLPDFAMALNNQSLRLSDLGWREEALARVEQAVSIYRELAEASPDAFLPGLALVLNNQSNCLANLGRREEALAAIEEAVSIYRQLAKARPDAFLPDFAMARHNQSLRLANLGRREEALAAIEEAVSIYRQLAKARPDVFLLPRLVPSLGSLADALAMLNREEEASVIRNEAAVATNAPTGTPPKEPQGEPNMQASDP